MKTTLWVPVGLAAILLAFSPAFGQDAGKATDARPVGVKTVIPIDQWLPMMTKELKLTSDEQTKMKANIEALKTAMAMWDKDNADKFTAAEAGVRKAMAGKDKDVLKDAEDAVKALKAERAKYQAEKEKEALSALTIEQQMEWERCILMYLLSQKYKQLTLTDDQIAKTRALCTEAGKLVYKAEDQATKEQIRQQTMREFVEKILTDKQREQLMGRRDNGGGFGGPAWRPGGGGGGGGGIVRPPGGGWRPRGR